MEYLISIAALLTSILALVISMRARSNESRILYAKRCATLVAEQWDLLHSLDQARSKLEFVPDKEFSNDMKPQIDSLYSLLETNRRHLIELLNQPESDTSSAVMLEKFSTSMKPLRSQVEVIENGIKNLLKTDK